MGRSGSSSGSKSEPGIREPIGLVLSSSSAPGVRPYRRSPVSRGDRDRARFHRLKLDGLDRRPALCRRSFSRSDLGVTSSTSLETLFDLSLPLKGGLLDSSRFLERISSILGRDLRLEDLEIPIIVTAEDIVTKRQIQHQRRTSTPCWSPPSPFRCTFRRFPTMIITWSTGITNLVPVGIAGEFTDSIILSTTFYENEELDLNNPVTILNV